MCETNSVFYSEVKSCCVQCNNVQNLSPVIAAQCSAVVRALYSVVYIVVYSVVYIVVYSVV